MLGPHTQTPEETIKEAAEWTAKNKHGEEVELDQEDQDILNETNEEELEMDDDTFEL